MRKFTLTVCGLLALGACSVKTDGPSLKLGDFECSGGSFSGEVKENALNLLVKTDEGLAVPFTYDPLAGSQRQDESDFEKAADACAEFLERLGGFPR